MAPDVANSAGAPPHTKDKENLREDEETARLHKRKALKALNIQLKDEGQCILIAFGELPLLIVEFLSRLNS